MDEHLVKCITDLRAAGVRISLAESQDAARALEQLNTLELEAFRAALQATLIKEHADEPIFDKLFPLYFRADLPPFLPPEQVLTPDQQELMEAATAALTGDASRLLRLLAAGSSPTYQELSHYARQGLNMPAWWPTTSSGLARKILRQMGMTKLDAQAEGLAQQLSGMGMGLAGLGAIHQLITDNQTALTGLVAEYAQQARARQLPQLMPEKLNAADLMFRNFSELSEAEKHALRQEVKRLGAKLRSRAALRQKKGAGRIPDVKATLRASLPTGGTPFSLHFRKKRLKPKFTLICDVSTSMRPVAEFLLRLVYEIQDQTTKVRSFAFNARLEEISDEFVGRRPNEAIPLILRRIPPGFYATNLGWSLADFCEHSLDAADRRTTVIFFGDARNNGTDPRLDLFELIKRRARWVVWFNPEPRRVWGNGDSDMLQYAPLCHAVHQVSNLAQLTEAVDKLFIAP
jgi:uncharacterized protein with von Willebrand factor type A (vWA) domain